MIVAFHSPQLGVRGTEVAMYDYAKYNQLLLNNKSIIFYDKKSNNNDETAIKKFSNMFSIYGYENFQEVHKILEKEKADLFYAIKSGQIDGIETKTCKTGIHVVFQHYQPHGDVYAYVARWVSEKLTNGSHPDVPHMFDMPQPDQSKEKTRQKYGIPNDCILFGRHGGCDEFNISFAIDAIKEIVNKRNDVYFVFVNTNKFYEHPQIVYLNKIVDMQEKSNWINCCDAMIHARSMGEIFSCSIGEFLYHGKPVFSCPYTSHDIGHIKFLGDKAIWYRSKQELIEKINNFDFKKIDEQKYKKLVEPFNSINVMNKFQEVFLK